MTQNQKEIITLGVFYILAVIYVMLIAGVIGLLRWMFIHTPSL